MKTTLLLILCTFALSSFASDTSSLNGIWKASQRGDYYYFHFEQDSLLKIVHGTDTSYLKYVVDTTQTPHFIDMEILDPQSGEVLYQNLGLYEWMNPKRIRFRMSDNMKDRPRGFLPKGNLDTYIINRQ